MSIQEHLNKIRNAVKGSEVRESIAKGIETAYDDASENGNANMEVKIARGTHPNLRDRLNEVDNTQQQTTAQLAQKATQTSLDIANANIIEFNDRVDNIIATPTTVSEQEIIDARQGNVSLGENIRGIKEEFNDWKSKELGEDYVLRELPNGVKDERVKGGVLKRTNRVVFNDNDDEGWKGSEKVDYYVMRKIIPDAKQGTTERHILKRGDFTYPFEYSTDPFTHFYMRDDTLYVFVKMSILLGYSGESVEERFGNYLKEKNLDFTYELDEPKILTYPTEPVTPNTFNIVELFEKIEGIKERVESTNIKGTKFPNYYPRNTLNQLISVDSLDEWITTTGNTGDTIEVVNGIETSSWSDSAKKLINPLIPNGKSSCIKLSAHVGTSMKYVFDEPIDLSSSSLGIMVFMDTEGGSPLDFYDDALDIRIHSGSSSDYFRFRIQPKNCYDNNWFLFSMQPTNYSKIRNPDISNINTLEILSGLPQGTDTPVYISSVFKIPNKVSRGKILIDFDDNHKSFYEEAYTYMTGKHGYRGTIHINGDKDGDPRYLTVEQMLRMQDDGWVVSNHTWSHINGRDMSYEDYEESLVKNIDWMAKQGFWYGDQIMATTNYTLSYKMNELLRSNGFKVIRAGYSNGRGSYISLPIVTMPLVQPIPANEISNTVSLEQWKSHLQHIQDSKSLAVNVFHNISNEGGTSIEHFRAMIDEIQNYDIDVITYADILMGNAD